MNRRSRILAQKHLTYSLVLLGLYLIQADPHLLYLGEIKPVLVLPFAVCIAMLEGELAGGLYGLAAGLLCDAGETILFGFNSLILMAASVAIGLLVIYYMQPSLTNGLIFTAGVFGIRYLLEFFFYFVMWKYEDVSLILTAKLLPMLLYTLVATPPIYWLCRRLNQRFARRLEDA